MQTARTIGFARCTMPLPISTGLTPPRPALVVPALAAVFVMITLCSASMAQVEMGNIDGGDIASDADAKPSAPTVSQDIIAKRIGGLPILRCKIRFREYEIEANLMFDISLGVPLQIHKLSVGGLGLDPMYATGQKVDIEFGNGVRLSGIPLETERYPLLEHHTRLYARDLKEVPVVGFIGLPAFKNNVVELDMGRELLRTMGMASDEARSKEMPYEVKPCGIVVKGTGPAGVPVQAVLTTQGHDSVLAPSVLKTARKKGVKPNVLKVGEVLFGDRSAIRFEQLDSSWPKSVNAVIGADALMNCTVTVWPKRKKIALRAQSTTPFPAEEQKYFLALADRNPEGVIKFIEGAPRRRLLDDACLALWTIRLEDPRSTPAVLKKAIETIADKYNSEHRSETLLNMADRLEGSRHKNREELIEHALKLAIRESGNAVEQTAVHDVHLRIGRRAFAKGDLKQARRHLLSAAFGMPKKGECNYWLGELYRQNGRLRRAWSRYFQATLDERLKDDDPIRELSYQRLAELNRDPEFRKTFNMVLAEQYLAGRLANSEFHAKTRYRFLRGHYPNHVKMIEFFVDSTQTDTGGMELAFQALGEFFHGEVALVAYHLNDPMHTEASKARLALYAKESPPLAAFDGKPILKKAIGDGKKPAEDAAANYPQFRRACLPQTAAKHCGWQVDGNIARDGSLLKIGLSVKGGETAEGLRLVVLLCERSVMAIENNGVFFHHYVVRDLLTPNSGLELKDVIKKPVALKVDVRELRKKIGAKLPERYRSGRTNDGPYIDANQLYVVGFVQRSSDSRILAAKTIGLPQNEDL